MILKGSQRGNGSDLAIHLMNGFDNERVEIAEVYGTVAGDLFGAFAEFEAVASGTRARQYLYSLSINPPSPLTREQYYEAIQAIETRLGLTDQPRAVVFHVKHGREHCHVVWSRIDIDKMTAVHMAHDRRRLMDLACDLARKFGLDLPPGLQDWEAKRAQDRDALEPTFAETSQAKIEGITPEERRAEITEAYEQSDSAEAFRAALASKGYVLARGDRRSLVIVDRHAQVHSLSRYIKGHRAKDINARLASIVEGDLPDVEQAKELARVRQQQAEELAAKLEQRQAQAEQEKAERQREREDKARRDMEERLRARHDQLRAECSSREQELLIRQQAERLSLHAAQKRESGGRFFRVRHAVAAFIQKTPALKSVLGPIEKLVHLDPAERQERERRALDARHRRERADVEREKRMLARLRKREQQSLQKELKRQARIMAEREVATRQDFFAAALDLKAYMPTDMESGDLQASFNEAASIGTPPLDDGDGNQRRPGWKERAEKAAASKKQGKRGGRNWQ